MSNITKKFKITNIDWDIDKDELIDIIEESEETNPLITIQLPTTMEIEITFDKDEELDIDDIISNELSNKIGWAVNSFNFEEENTKKNDDFHTIKAGREKAEQNFDKVIKFINSKNCYMESGELSDYLQDNDIDYLYFEDIQDYFNYLNEDENEEYNVSSREYVIFCDNGELFILPSYC